MELSTYSRTQVETFVTRAERLGEQGDASKGLLLLLQLRDQLLDEREQTIGHPRRCVERDDLTAAVALLEEHIAAFEKSWGVYGHRTSKVLGGR